jgi:hypothetical protein
MLKPNQAIIKYNTIFGYSDVFLITMINNQGKYIIKESDINGKFNLLMRNAKVDFKDKNITVYCKKGISFKKIWNSINTKDKTVALY